jgi:hypothetical protein
MKLFWRFVSFVCCMALVACGEVYSWPAEKFDSHRWKQTVEVKRYVFAKDLIDRRLLIGKTRGEVVELLGAPSSENSSPRAMQYLIKSGGVAMDQLFALDVQLGGVRGEVTSVGIRGD